MLAFVPLEGRHGGAFARDGGQASRVSGRWNSLDRELPEDYAQNITDPQYQAARALLEEAAADVRRRYPDLDVGTVLLAQAPTDGLIGLAEHAGVPVIVVPN